MGLSVLWDVLGREALLEVLGRESVFLLEDDRKRDLSLSFTPDLSFTLDLRLGSESRVMTGRSETYPRAETHRGFVVSLSCRF